MRPHPFRPLSDTEYALLARHLPPIEHSRGRPPQDRRRTLDAIFWIACSTGPWKDLPPEYGRADTASRQLRRWARSGVMDLLLNLVATRRRRDTLLRSLAWRICRAYRRITRIIGLGSLMLARRLGLQPALPAAPHHLPDPILSEIVQARIRAALEKVQQAPIGLFGGLARLIGAAGGNRRHWRLR